MSEMVAALKEKMKRLQMLESQGLISSAEGRELQVSLTEAESELELAALEMEVLEKIQ